jgi:transposase
VKHVAIDLGGRESQICIRQADGTIVQERRVPTSTLAKLMRQWEPSRVIVETSAEAFNIADSAKAAGHEVRVVPATLVRQLGVGDRGVKTDRKDAQTLSRVSCQIDLPSVHVPSELSRKLKSLCGNREELIECRTKLINNVRGWLRGQLWRVRTGATSSFPERVLEYATKIEQQFPDHIARTLSLIDELNKQIRVADQDLRQIAIQHPVCQKLMTVPGVGPVTSVRFLAALDQVTRFPNAHAVQSYVGLTPGENSSSDRKQRTGITKAGPAKLRRTLIQAAWCVMRNPTNDPLSVWATQLATRKHKFVAVVALARKLVGILFAIWRDGTTYRAQPAVQPAA